MATLPDLDAPLRAAILNDSSITALLPTYKNSHPVFTKRPVRKDTTAPYIVIHQNNNLTHDDGVNDQRITVDKELTIYDAANPPPEGWRKIDQIGRLIAARFHRRPRNLVLSTADAAHWKVIDIRVTTRGFPPFEILAQNVGFTVVLSIILASKNTQ